MGPPGNRFVRYAPHELILLNFAARAQKLAQLTHFNVIANVVQGATFENRSKQGRTETALGILPLSHSYGLVLGHLLAWRGDCIILHPRFDMQVVLTSIARYSIERLYLVRRAFTARKFPHQCRTEALMKRTGPINHSSSGRQSIFI